MRINKKSNIKKKLARNIKIIQKYHLMNIQTKTSMIEKEIIYNVKSAMIIQSIIKNQIHV